MIFFFFWFVGFDSKHCPYDTLPLLLAAMKFGWREVVPIRAGFTGKANKLGWTALKP